MINDYGSPSLRSVDPAANAAITIQWQPTSQPSIFELSYDFRMESYSSTGRIAYQIARVNTASSQGSVGLTWEDGGTLESVGMLNNPSFTWALNTPY